MLVHYRTVVHRGPANTRRPCIGGPPSLRLRVESREAPMKESSSTGPPRHTVRPGNLRGADDAGDGRIPASDADRQRYRQGLRRRHEQRRTLQDHLGRSWPQGLTLEQNLIDLGWHQKEFQKRRSFAYTVVKPDETQVLGCVYIQPTRKRGYDAEIRLWARQSELASGLEDRLYAAVSGWVAARWPFKSVAFPGRSVAWEVWRAIPDERR